MKREWRVAGGKWRVVRGSLPEGGFLLCLWQLLREPMTWTCGLFFATDHSPLATHDWPLTTYHFTNVVGLAIGDAASTYERYRPLFQLPSDCPAGTCE